ncbi:MAG: serine hydrolase domain-containing protein [Candidatus Aminicenantales bacterium]
MRFPVRQTLALFLALLAFSGCGPSSSKTSKPEEAGLSGKHLRLLDGMINNAIARKDFPGAVVLIGRKGKTVFRKAYGESQWVPERKPLDETMIFDLASVTKPVATATSFMILVEEGKISLDEKVKEYVPGFAPYINPSGKPGEDARIWHLLTHTSGLPPYAEVAEVEEALGRPCTTAQLVGYIAQLPKTDPPGTAFHYSCLGYITLAHILKMVSGQDIAVFSEERIFKPLKMRHTFFSPPEKFRSRCVPTEVINKKPLSGVVHDPLARLQGGISGNAGLFSTADDLAVFARMMLDKGSYKGGRILSPLAVERMTTVWSKASFAGRGLGWDLDSPYSTNGGDLFGPNAYGHTGYTGTSIWIDPDTETYVIFLTNRVHPGDKGAIIALRSRVANVVAAAIQAPKTRSALR